MEDVLKYDSLVRSIAWPIAKKVPSLGFEDLVQEGWIGLINAQEMYDASLGSLFSTYAHHKIKSAIMDFMRYNDVLSRHSRELRTKISKAESKLFKELYRKPTMSEIASEASITLKVLSKAPVGASVNHSFDADSSSATLTEYTTPESILIKKQHLEAIEKLLTEEEWKLLNLMVVDGLDRGAAGKQMGLQVEYTRYCMKKIMQKLEKFNAKINQHQKSTEITVKSAAQYGDAAGRIRGNISFTAETETSYC
jgi:RNA polymerase sigma factor (sigma-70 family)